MIAILETHPIQYHAPLWRELNKLQNISFEVWYLTRHALENSYDEEFQTAFKWDVDLLDGYPYRFISEPAPSELGGFWDLKLPKNFRNQLKDSNMKVILIQGWHFFACIKAIYVANSMGISVWIRGDSNDLKVDSPLKRIAKRIILGFIFRRVDKFLCVGKATKRLYTQYGISEDRMVDSPHAVDNKWFASQSLKYSSERQKTRDSWGIDSESYCVVFVGKFVQKKRPQDLIAAVKCLQDRQINKHLHILFVGSGELGELLKSECNVVFNSNSEEVVQADHASNMTPLPKASFVGFLNQSEISQAYVAADLLVLPSNSSETWGLVVNEAMASGVPCVISDQCGCSEDLTLPFFDHMRYTGGSVSGLADAIESSINNPPSKEELLSHVEKYSFTVSSTAIQGLLAQPDHLKKYPVPKKIN